LRNSKQHRQLESINRSLLESMMPLPTAAMVVRVEEVKGRDEMWSVVQSKRQQRWLWQAIDHQSGDVLAYGLAPHEDQALKALMDRLTPLGIQQVYTDSWGAYWRLLRHELGRAI
jgi:insertion element IS1 protein InsB